jgi:hypothetical protein
MSVTKLGHGPIAHRVSWLRLYDVALRFTSNTVTLGPQCCSAQCHEGSVTVREITEDLLEPIYPDQVKLFQAQIQQQRVFLGAIVMLNGGSFFRTVKKEAFKVCKTSLDDINTAIEAEDLKKCPLDEIVPKQYHEFLLLLSKGLADRLPPCWPGNDHEVCLKERQTPKWSHLYSMSRAELVVLKEWVEETISKWSIQQLSSPCTAPVFIAKKHGGGMWFCIYYPDMNSKRYRIHIPVL